MNHYQKVIICIFRTLGVILVGYALVMMVMAVLLGMAIFAFVPIMAAGLLSYFGATPFSKIITIGLDD
ncbi:hypothetical protein [Cerasicoccus fimbriatus]|uniref:hypothetical protein n=1 Tax=Cerasicoccus fimbriatus TaxID=3014554 RepID=UPI0022B3AC8D|nr:hypothetical protein [Cerasicoccus sp. TK19100]